MKHTPGPWHVNPFSAQVDVFTPEPVPICKLLWPSNERGEEETEANAHLIAAAPEMYEWLKELRGNAYPHVANENITVVEMENEVLGWLDRVLAKAEGGE